MDNNIYNVRRIAAGIVLYNPDTQRLEQNITAILPQVSELYLIDNASASSSWSECMAKVAPDAKVITLKNKKNEGIAVALNQMMRLGQERGMDWVLTLDQDSVCPPDMISQMLPYARSMARAGILCPVIADRSFGIEHLPSQTEHITQLKECITSASLTRVKAWEEAGGFDSQLFIDAVDTDFCLTLRAHGWQIIQVNNTQLTHEIGHQATLHELFGRRYIAFNHAAIRYYYMARNLVYLSRKHPGYLQPAPYRCIPTLLARMLVILCWERDEKFAKCRQIIRGFLDGCKSFASST